MSLKVALAGATGNLGPAVLAALTTAGFEITVLTRSSNNSFDSKVKVAEVDYQSVDSLEKALANQEALVITLGAVGLEPHTNLIKAAVAANVKRIIPAEFGSDTTNPNAAALPVFADKVAVQKQLKEIVASSSTTSYTSIVTGPFLDWGLMVKFLIDLSSPEPVLYDAGERKISVTTLPGIGKAVVGVLKNLDATKNKTVFVREAELSQKDLLQLAGKQVSNGQNVSTADLEKEAFAELQKPEPNVHTFVFGFLKRAIFGEGFGSLFPAENLSNELLGVGKLSNEELKALVSKYA
ncbi:uncharacterized protein N7483_012950 [Penicillium malachiteum]|uniref:uncharacterized protein n=1 Tax=Penicillium malachiteum TaxID=1324776 RepID=UPI002546C391|nr:uncharacterized protein N7483_012950 [Penicillium malachiteum]KAJ5715769.1 hypothetical protein N7483_012950 [Penicillium malachiteum]